MGHGWNATNSALYYVTKNVALQTLYKFEQT